MLEVQSAFMEAHTKMEKDHRVIHLNINNYRF